MDGTESPKDALPGTGQPSEGGKGTPPPEKTYSEAEHRKAISDLKAEQGRKEKELARNLKEAQAARESLEKSHDTTTARLAALEERINDGELETVRDNPNLLKAYQEKQSLTQRVRDYEKKERDLAAREARIAALETEAQETKKGALLSLVADKVTPEKLERLKGLSLEALEVMVDVIGKGPTPSATPGAPEFKPDSAVSSGGVGALTSESVEQMPVSQLQKRLLNK